MARRTDLGLILRRFRFGETSLVLHAVTREHGKVHLLAKGAYRPTARYYAALDLFDSLELEWQETPGRELGNLSATVIRTRRHRLAGDLERYKAALCVLELADLGIPEGPANAELFALASTALDRLLQPGSVERALVEFELAFLQNLGLSPSLSDCAACAGPAPAAGEPESRRATFSAQGGGRLCARCASEARALGRRVGTLPESVLAHTARISANLEDVSLRARSGNATDNPAGDSLDARTTSLVHDVVARFLEHQLQGRPKSYRSFLSAPQRNSA